MERALEMTFTKDKTSTGLYKGHGVGLGSSLANEILLRTHGTWHLSFCTTQYAVERRYVL